MAKNDPRVDAFIAKSAEFAKPILMHLRKVIHKACPDAEETVKWGMPFFEYHGVLCHMAAFKAHCSFGFWLGPLVFEEAGVKSTTPQPTGEGMGHFGRITSLKDLPAEKIFVAYVKAAVRLNEAGVTLTDRRNAAKATTSTKAAGAGGAAKRGGAVSASKEKTTAVPAYFSAALKKNKKAAATFTAFTPGKRREYLDWVAEAKTEETRAKRLATSMEWLSEGKIRNWKYVKG